MPKFYDSDIEAVAKVAYSANKAFCETLGDYSQPVWEDAPDWQKESAINGVKLHIETLTVTPSGSHDNWMKEKLKDGWKYGEVKNSDKKEHSCLVPYDELPVEQQVKDSIFLMIVKAFLHHI